MSSNLSNVPVRNLRKSVKNAYEFEAEQTKRIGKRWDEIVAAIFVFAKQYSEEQIKLWVAEIPGVKATKKANAYTNAAKIAFSSDNGELSESDQKINQYATACLALDHFKVTEKKAVIYMVSESLTGLLSKYYDETRVVKSSGSPAEQKFRKSRKEFSSKYKGTKTLGKNTVQVVVSVTDNNGNVVASHIVDDDLDDDGISLTAKKLINKYGKPNKTKQKPFKSLIDFYRTMPYPFVKKDDVRFCFENSGTINVTIFSLGVPNSAVVTVMNCHELSEQLPKGHYSLSAKNLDALKSLSTKCNDCEWSLKGNSIVIVPNGKNVSEQLKSIRQQPTSKKYNWPIGVEINNNNLKVNFVKSPTYPIVNVPKYDDQGSITWNDIRRLGDLLSNVDGKDTEVQFERTKIVAGTDADQKPLVVSRPEKSVKGKIGFDKNLLRRLCGVIVAAECDVTIKIAIQNSISLGFSQNKKDYYFQIPHYTSGKYTNLVIVK